MVNVPDFGSCCAAVGVQNTASERPNTSGTNAVRMTPPLSWVDLPRLVHGWRIPVRADLAPPSRFVTREGLSFNVQAFTRRASRMADKTSWTKAHAGMACRPACQASD